MIASKKINLCEEEKMAPVFAHSASGHWGFPTATMDWCEQNYEVSILVLTEGVKHTYRETFVKYSSMYSVQCTHP